MPLFIKSYGLSPLGTTRVELDISSSKINDIDDAIYIPQAIGRMYFTTVDGVYGLYFDSTAISSYALRDISKPCYFVKDVDFGTEIESRFLYKVIGKESTSPLEYDPVELVTSAIYSCRLGRFRIGNIDYSENSYVASDSQSFYISFDYDNFEDGYCDISNIYLILRKNTHLYKLVGERFDFYATADKIFTEEELEQFKSFSGEQHTFEYLGKGSLAYYTNASMFTVESYMGAEAGSNPYDGGGTSSSDGGGGDFGKNPDGTDIPSDDISAGIPNGSAETALSPGAIFTTYITNNSELYDLSRWLWAEEGGLGGILFKEFLESLFGNFNDAIILFQSYPFAIDSMNVSTFVTDFAFGRADTRVQTLGLTNGSCSHNWGTVNISEYWGNFLDYAPHTKIELYLPWGVGTVQIDPNEVMGESLSVTTNFDLHKGACCHIVHTASGRVLGAYNGVCARQLPITGSDTAGKATALVASAVSLAVAAGAGVGAYNAGNQAFNKAIVEHTNRLLTDKSYTHSPEGLRRLTQEAVAKAKEPYKKVGQKAKVIAAGSAVAAFRIPMSLYRNGSFTAEGSGLGIQYPYLIITRPSQSVPQEYGHHYGYPSNIYSQLSALRGYTEICEIHLTDVRVNNVFATLEEMEEIEEILKGGVVF